MNSNKKFYNVNTNVNQGYQKDRVHLSLDAINTKQAVVVSNMNSNLIDVKDRTVRVLGITEQDDNEGFVIRTHGDWGTRWFTMNPAMCDWGSVVFHKYISWMTMEEETRTSQQGLIGIKNHERTMSSLIMLINNAKFSQVAELVRYVFVNSTGISTGCYPLYDKIFKWFKPEQSSDVERLFILRMLKMSTLVELVGAN